MISTVSYHLQITKKSLPEHTFNQFSLYISSSEEEQGLGIINTGDDLICIDVGYDNTTAGRAKGSCGSGSGKRINRRNRRLAAKPQEVKTVVEEDMRSQRLARSALNSLVCQHNYSWSLNIFQNFGLLRSKEAKGTTGAVIWKVSHKMLQWLFTDFEAVQGPVKYQLAYNYKLALFAPNNSIVELGCGISGIFTSTVGSKVSTYIATDQSHIIKHSSRNILANVNKSQVYSTTIDELSDTSNASCRGKSKIEIVEYDWEQANQQIDRLKNYLPETSTTVAGRFPDWILASDTIYNSFLIPWFVDALKLVCGPHTQILIAQQLRSEEIFGEFLEALLSKGFEVWAIGMADDTVHDCSRGKDYIPSGFTDTELLENGLLGKGYSLHYLRLSQKVD